MNANPDPAVDLQLSCAWHPDRAAQWLCADCGQGSCSACVQPVMLDAGKTVFLCPACKGVCEAPRRSNPELPGHSYVGGLFAALGFPFRSEALGLMLAAALLQLAAGLMGRVLLFSGLFMVLSFGLGCYLVLFLRQVLASTAHHEALTGWPAADMEALKEAALEFMAVSVCCFGPWTLCKIWLQPESEGLRWLSHGLLAGGSIYFPMAVLAVVIYDNLAAMNPVLVFVSIVRTAPSYFILCAFLAALVAAVLSVEAGLSSAFGPRVSDAVTGFTSGYAAIVAMRAIGWFYRSHHARLNWS